MNLQPYFEAQKKLDEHIIQEKVLQGRDLLDKKILALQVELGELANEWRGFKFWSEDQEPRTKEIDYLKVTRDNVEFKNPLLEEYVDCLHFILSIGNDIRDNPTGDGYIEYKESTDSRDENIVDGFIGLHYLVSCLDGRSVTLYDMALFEILMLGEMLGFTEQQIHDAYFDKNATNHKRQQNGY